MVSRVKWRLHLKKGECLSAWELKEGARLPKQDDHEIGDLNTQFVVNVHIRRSIEN
jgi:hypothetical protein